MIVMIKYLSFFQIQKIIHCSNGVGRTGTYITIDSQIHSIKSNNEINICKNVCQLRCVHLFLEIDYRNTLVCVHHFLEIDYRNTLGLLRFVILSLIILI